MVFRITFAICQHDIVYQLKSLFKWNFVYIMTIRIVYWDTRDDGLVFWYARGILPWAY